MTRHKHNTSIGGLIMFLYFSAFVGLAGAQTFHPLGLDASRVPWTELSFHAKNFWVEVSTDVQLISLPAVEVEALLLPSPEGVPIKPTKSQVSQMTINTTIDPKFRSPVNIYNRIWFDPMDASAMGRIRLRRGEDDFKKIYRFTRQGVFRHQTEPMDRREAALEPDEWTDIKDTFYPYDTNQLGCPVVSERSVLLYILSAALRFEGNDSMSLCVFGKRQLHRIQLRKEGTLPLKINYIEKSQQKGIRKEGMAQAHKITIAARPIGSGAEDGENFSFLGFQKNIAIYVDSTSHLPLQASGIIPTIGEAHLMLHEYQMQIK